MEQVGGDQRQYYNQVSFDVLSVAKPGVLTKGSYVDDDRHPLQATNSISVTFNATHVQRETV